MPDLPTENRPCPYLETRHGGNKLVRYTTNKWLILSTVDIYVTHVTQKNEMHASLVNIVSIYQQNTAHGSY